MWGQRNISTRQVPLLSDSDGRELRTAKHSAKHFWCRFLLPRDKKVPLLSCHLTIRTLRDESDYSRDTEYKHVANTSRESTIDIQFIQLTYGVLFSELSTDLICIFSFLNRYAKLTIERRTLG